MATAKKAASAPDAFTDLIRAQAACEPLVKNAVNPHFKNRYADLGACIDACKDAFHKNNFAVLQVNDADHYGQFVNTILLHQSGERFGSKVYLSLSKQDMQGLGSAITYARRYGLLGLAGLAAEDDDGNASVPSNSPTIVKSSTPPTAKAAASF